MHNIEYRIFPEDVNFKKATKQINDFVKEQTWGEGGNGLNGGIRWFKNHVAKDQADAETFLRNNDRGYYDNLAVRFIVSKPPKTKSHQTLLSRRDEIQKVLNERRNRIHYGKGNTKSNFVSCKECGSKLNTDYVKSNRCPMCGNDLRPESVLNQIKTSERMLKDVEKKIREAVNAYSKKKPEIKWLVKFEYHT